MLNYLWAGMILIGIIFAAFTGRMPDITNAAIDSSKEAITLCITMMGVMSFWVGLMDIATRPESLRALPKRSVRLYASYSQDSPPGTLPRNTSPPIS